MTQEELGERSGFAVSQISRWERGERTLTLDQLEALAAALSVRTGELLGPTAQVPIVGYVGAGQEVIGVDDHPAGQGMYSVDCPEGLSPETTVGVEVRGDSMLPIADGWLLFYSRTADYSRDQVLNKLCVVKLVDTGAYYVKRLRPGYDAERFNLISTNASPIENVLLEWAAPVQLLLPGARESAPG